MYHTCNGKSVAKRLPHVMGSCCKRAVEEKIVAKMFGKKKKYCYYYDLIWGITTCKPHTLYTPF